jgi:hypothetical protein
MDSGNPGLRGVLTLESVEEVDWSDGCLGIARPNALCQPGPVPGYRAVIGHERETVTWLLHTDEQVDRVAWAADQEAEGTIVELTGGGWIIEGEGGLFTDTIDPGRINVSIRSGTDLRTPLAELAAGSQVAFGIAGLPSSDVAALVWIEAR